MAGTRKSRVTRSSSTSRSTVAGSNRGSITCTAAEGGHVVRRAPAVDVEQRDRVQDDVVARAGRW